MSNEIFRLAKPVKKGILHLVFSRFLIIVLLLLLQLAVIIGIYLWLDEYKSVIGIIYALFEFAMTIYLFNCSMDYTGKLSWMFVIALFPLAGAALLWFTKLNINNRALQRGVVLRIRETRNALPQDPRVITELKEDGSGMDALCRYLNHSGCFPVYDQTDVTYFPSGEETFAAMLRELKKAEKYIFLEYFIIEEGYMWGEILRILTKKAEQGVDVRVLYDGMCEISQLPPGYWKLLEQKGIRAKAFSPIMPVISSRYNYRDHRKILVIDGKVAFNGGINLADEYINRTERFGHWKDTAVMLQGDAAASFTLMFLQMWRITEKEPETEASAFQDITETFPADYRTVPRKLHSSYGYVMPYADCPLDEYKAGEAVYMDILNRARKYVYIMTPYLILDGELENAITYAALRGTDIRIILPGIPDKKVAYALAKSHYRSLLNAGVKIYEYTPGFVHAKVVISDDIKAVVGTINFDYRSLYHHFECATYLYQTPCIADIREDVQNTMAECRRVTLRTVKKEKLYYKIMGSLMKFLAPMM